MSEILSDIYQLNMTHRELTRLQTALRVLIAQRPDYYKDEKELLFRLEHLTKRYQQLGVLK